MAQEDKYRKNISQINYLIGVGSYGCNLWGIGGSYRDSPFSFHFKGLCRR